MKQRKLYRVNARVQRVRVRVDVGVRVRKLGRARLPPNQPYSQQTHQCAYLQPLLAVQAHSHARMILQKLNQTQQSPNALAESTDRSTRAIPKLKKLMMKKLY